MSAQILKKLESLRADFQSITGKPFRFFYCPILFKDEDVPICKAHILNAGLPNTAREWTIQRKDIDNFYGSYFESDFGAIRYKNSHTIGGAFTDKKLSQLLKPKILVDGEPVSFFRSKHGPLENATKMILEDKGKIAELWLRMNISEVSSKKDQDWQLEIQKDIRIPAIVSLIKAAHLSLFHVLGYHYALSASGHFIGYDILGKFYLESRGLSKERCLSNALSFLAEYAHLVRPIIASEKVLEGTLKEKQMLVCRNTAGRYWAFIVFIRIIKTVHAVLMPIFQSPDDIEYYLSFIKNLDETLQVCHCQFKQDHWEIGKQSVSLNWPKKGITLA